MASLFKGGAFAQQCFYAHREALTFRKTDDPHLLILDCKGCRIDHRLNMVQEGLTLPEAIAKNLEHLSSCITSHPRELRVSVMDIVRDYVGAHCGQCRKKFDLNVAAFETSR